MGVNDHTVKIDVHLSIDDRLVWQHFRRRIPRLLLHDAILDGEAIALRSDGTPLPFQVTMRRFGRKLEVESLRTGLPLASFFFDILYADGAPLLDEPYARPVLDGYARRSGVRVVPLFDTEATKSVGLAQRPQTRSKPRQQPGVVFSSQWGLG